MDEDAVVYAEIANSQLDEQLWPEQLNDQR